MHVAHVLAQPHHRGKVLKAAAVTAPLVYHLYRAVNKRSLQRDVIDFECNFHSPIPSQQQRTIFTNAIAHTASLALVQAMLRISPVALERMADLVSREGAMQLLCGKKSSERQQGANRVCAASKVLAEMCVFLSVLQFMCHVSNIACSSLAPKVYRRCHRQGEQRILQ